MINYIDVIKDLIKPSIINKNNNENIFDILISKI
jgi:hypothetical protein